MKHKETKQPFKLNIFLLLLLIPLWLLMKLGEGFKTLVFFILSVSKNWFNSFAKRVSILIKKGLSFRIKYPENGLFKFKLPQLGLPNLKAQAKTRSAGLTISKPKRSATLKINKKGKQKKYSNLKIPNFSAPSLSFLAWPFLKIKQVSLLFKTNKPKKKRRTYAIKVDQLPKKSLLSKILPTPIRIVLILVVFLSAFFFYSYFLIVTAHDLPSPQKLTQIDSPATTEFYDRNGKLLYRLYEGKNRTPVKLADLPKPLVQATIAIEDKNFYAHNGVDIYGVTRAAIAMVQNHQIQGGGSTITQQLIKNTLLTPEQTFKRKVKEVMLAFWAERLFTKDEILQMYFNEVPYGGPAWGIAAAAQTYFDKNVKDLDLAEASYLAGLPASPTTYSPYGNNPELGKARQKEVLRRMAEEKYITKEQSEEAYNEPLNIKPPSSPIKAPHFVMYVRSLLAQKYGEKVVSQGGLKVTTTLDLDTQDMAEGVVSDEVSKLANLNVSNGSAVITNTKGEILAMVGSKNYWEPNGGNFNVATALRQPGSSIKPVTYVTGFKKGYSPGTTLLDAPVAFRSPWEVYAPVNYDGKFHGAVTVRTALGSSYNIPAVKMLALVGIPEMVQTARDMGITTFTQPDRYGLSLTLGGAEVKLVDMMSVYGTFANNGLRYPVQGVLKVTDPSGNVLEDNSNQTPQKALSAGISYMITSILSDNGARTPAFGPNSLLIIPGHSVAVKTGTTDSKRDNWTFGYSPQYVVGVWVGNNDNSPMNPALSSGVTGAAPIWNKLFTNLLQDKPNLAFERPPEIAEGVVEGHKDLVIAGINQKPVVAQGKRKIKDDKKNSDEKEVITFTDPFSVLQSDQTGQLQPILAPTGN